MVREAGKDGRRNEQGSLVVIVELSERLLPGP